ncbi:MAG: UDP-N-acetylmuramoyl-tripeptide--D-alanyl-D-alanine ligase [Planctomycetota bacterium]
MIEISLTELHRAASVIWDAGDSGRTISSISTDTRELRPGSLFVGLDGPNFRGSEFAEAAFEAGAAAVIIQEPASEDELRVSQLTELADRYAGSVAVVADSRAALGALGSLVRQRLAGSAVAITGSCGKTSTKAILAHMLRGGAGAGNGVVASPKSFNNYVGVPRTLFLCERTTRFAVLEVGTNAPGEIADLAEIARPDVAMITMIGRAHLEGLGTLEGVADEKGALLESIDPGAKGARAILNADCPMTSRLLERVPEGVPVTTFGCSAQADVLASDVRLTARGTEFVLDIDPALTADRDPVSRLPIVVPLLGAHAVQNVVAALAAVLAVEGDLDAALDSIASLGAEPHRLQPTVAGGVLVIDDAYNANPESMAAAVATLMGVERSSDAWPREPGGEGPQRVLVVGAMGEMGDGAADLHAESGSVAGASGIDRLFLTGTAADAPLLAAFRDGAIGAGLDPGCIQLLESLEDTVDGLCRILRPGDICLVKASRAARLERVASAVATRFSAADPALPSPEAHA